MVQVELECRFRPDGQMVAANAAYCQYFQCCPDTLAQQPQPPHLAQSIDSWPHLNLSALTPSRGQINHELQVQAPNGAIAWQQWYNQGSFDPQGCLVEVRAVGRDITRYKLIETRLHQQIGQEQALGRIVDRIRQSLDVQDIFTVATAEVRQLLGCDRATIYQFTPDWGGCFMAESVDSQWVPLVADNVRTLWVDTYLQDHQGGRYRHHETLAIEDIYLSGHAPCHLDILEQFQVRAYTVVPIFKEDQLWGLISAYQNTGPRRWQPEEITLLAQVARHLGLALHHGELLIQFKQAKEGAEQANRAKSNFLSHMSHELRTPLNAIIGYAQFMLRENTVSPEQQDYLKTINASGEHLLSLINDILSMSKIEAGQMTLVLTEFSLADTLQQLVDILAAQAAEKATTLTVNLDADVPPNIRSDRGKLQQILLNLLGNSVKFTEAGTITLTVSVVPAPSLPFPTDTTRPPCYLQFTVTDTGTGIPEDQVQQLFQPFIQTQARANAPEGTGLGLAISHQFATLLQGDLVLESTGPQGSTFQLTLPVEPIATVSMQPRQVHHQVIGLAADHPPVRILIAEDKAPSRQLMVKLLESVGFQVRAVTNGVEALEQWESWQPQLIFMDLRMPVLDGYQATQQIKSAAGDCPPIIVALTASAFDEDEQIALDYGCDDFVRKPVREVDLFEVIAQRLGVRYRYEDQSPRAAPLLPATDLLGHIATMPGGWVDRLHKAALTANRTTLDALLDNLPESQLALAQTLRVWVDNFRSDKIVALIEQIRDSSGSPETNDPSG